MTCDVPFASWSAIQLSPKPENQEAKGVSLILG